MTGKDLECRSQDLGFQAWGVGLGVLNSSFSVFVLVWGLGPRASGTRMEAYVYQGLGFNMGDCQNYGPFLGPLN